MAKEYVYASRDIQAGEEMMGVVQREHGYFYFVDAAGNVLRAKQSRREPLTEVEIARRAAQKAAQADFRAKKKAARELAKKKASEAAAQRRALRQAEKEKKRLVSEAKVKARIAALQAKLR